MVKRILSTNTDHEHHSSLPLTKGSDCDESMSYREEVCPWCHGVGGQWEAVETKTVEIKLYESCRGCHGLGKILRNSE